MATGLVIFIPVLILAAVGPLFAPFSPTEFVAPAFSGPGSGGSLFGTDGLGRDVWSRFLSGGQELIVLGVLSAIVGVVIGGAIGVFSGYRGGVEDELLGRSNDILLAFPPIVLALLFLALLGPQFWLLVLVVALGHIPRTYRVMRGATIPLRRRDFVAYAHAIGMKPRRIIWKELLPNLTPVLMVESGIRFTYSLGLLAGMSFLGLGVQPPNPDWGLMVNENRIGMVVQPWGVILPLLGIALLTIGSNLIADGVALRAIKQKGMA